MRPSLARTSVLTFTVLLAACGGGGGATQRPSVAAPATTRPATAPATVAPATVAPMTVAPATSAPATAAPVTPAMSPGAVTVMLATSDLGEIVVDAAGMTLYAFTPDEAGGVSTCYDTCAQNWPPLAAPDQITAGEGLDVAMFTAVPRDDAAGDQVKFGDWPLYYFAGDEAPGDTNGQGLNDAWYVVGADGELITEEPAS